jgi:hypothetical protein
MPALLFVLLLLLPTFEDCSVLTAAGSSSDGLNLRRFAGGTAGASLAVVTSGFLMVRGLKGLDSMTQAIAQAQIFFCLTQDVLPGIFLYLELPMSTKRVTRKTKNARSHASDGKGDVTMHVIRNHLSSTPCGYHA